jgi:hypothetical protein
MRVAEAGMGMGREGARRAASAEGRARGYAAGGATTEEKVVTGAHQEASSDRVGAGLRGDGTAPRFYKKVDVIAMEDGGGWGVALDGRVLKTPKKQGRSTWFPTKTALIHHPLRPSTTQVIQLACLAEAEATNTT